MRQKFLLGGMTCSACSAAVERAVKKLDGVQSVNVNLMMGSMTVEFFDEKISDKDIVLAVEKAGYTATIADISTHSSKNAGTYVDMGGGERSSVVAADSAVSAGKVTAVAESEAAQKRRFWLKSSEFPLVLSAFLLILLMYVSMGHMIGAPLPSVLVHNPMIFALTQFTLTLPIMILGRGFFVRGVKAVAKRTPNMDVLVSLGAGAAFIYSFALMFLIAFAMGKGEGALAHDYAMDLYFESAATILTFISVGKFLEHRSKGRAADAIKKLMDLTPKTANILVGGVLGGVEKNIPASQLKAGDLVVIRSGESLPADGEIVQGNATLDESAITGESLPLDKKAGDRVTGGTINRSGYFVFVAQKVGEDTAISAIIRLVSDANSSKAPAQKLADRVSGVFVPVVLCIALVAFSAWMIAGFSFAFALKIAIAVLVISCPCALGLATPAAIMTGTGRAAQLGILFKTAESLENLHKCDVVFLDKTGTVTMGKPSVTDVVSVGAEDELLALAASVERLSEHPLAYAIVSAAGQKSLALQQATEFEARAGEGIFATVAGKKIAIGNFALAQAKSQQNPLIMQILDKFMPQSHALAGQGKTVLFVFENDDFCGLIAIADTIKPESFVAISALKALGKQVVMLTGDNKMAAQQIATQAGIDTVLADLKPEDKESEVRRFQALGHKVMFVGDGINDAPALTRADTGIAIGAGTDIAIDSADVVLMGDGLMGVPTAVRLSKAALKNIKENLFWAFFYNSVCIPLAAGAIYPISGWTLSPMIAAAAMSLSSVFVVANALRLRFFRPKIAPKTVLIDNNETINIKEDTMKKTIFIQGMMCGHCSGRVTSALTAIEGMKVEVSHQDGTATVEGQNLDNEILIAAIKSAGYTVTKIQDK